MATSHQIVVFTRENCHLCQDAMGILAKYQLSANTVDIDSDETLVDRYNDCVPVVVIDGKERFRGRINEVLLRRILAHGVST